MDFIAFLTTWFWYVIAFCIGALVAWLVARQFVPAQTPREAIEGALAERAAESHDADDRGGEYADDEYRDDEYPTDGYDDTYDARGRDHGHGATSATEVRR